jgi:hypothetical protein
MDGPRFGIGFYEFGEFAHFLFGFYFFRIFDIGIIESVFRKNDGGDIKPAEEGASSGFINTDLVFVIWIVFGL